MIVQKIDVTTTFNANNIAVLDVGGWENVIIHMIGTVTGTIVLQGSNDGGEVTGSVEESPTTADNFNTIVATSMSVTTVANTLVTSLAAAGLYKITQPPKYIRFGGPSAAATKVLVLLSKVV